MISRKRTSSCCLKRHSVELKRQFRKKSRSRCKRRSKKVPHKGIRIVTSLKSLLVPVIRKLPTKARRVMVDSVKALLRCSSRMKTTCNVCVTF